MAFYINPQTNKVFCNNIQVNSATPVLKWGNGGLASISVTGAYAVLQQINILVVDLSIYRRV